MTKEHYVKICPRCGSTDITNVQANVGSSMTSSLMDYMKDKCRMCNYTGQMPEIDLDEIETFRKKLKKRQ